MTQMILRGHALNSRADLIASRRDLVIRIWVADLEDAHVVAFMHWWTFWARYDQLPPPGDWRCWLYMGGRGAGKTRAGAEWIAGEIAKGRAARVALVGPTMNDVREVMIAGPSGIANIGETFERPAYEPSRHRISWPNGAIGYAFSAEEPERLRGPQFDAAWIDEIGAWDRATAFDMLQFGLRLGDHPRLVATTTPKDTPLVKRLVKDPQTVMTRGRSALNAANLSPGFVDAMKTQYGSSELARQELEGELIEGEDKGLFSLGVLDNSRVIQAPALVQVIVAVDPPAMAHAGSDACGIIVIGRAEEEAYILHDATVQGLSPEGWSNEVKRMAEMYGADEILAESNQGGEMVRRVLQTAGIGHAIRLVHAHLSKARRAAPVAALYQAGRVHHVGYHRALEDEMLAFGTSGDSPNRLDALVHGVTHLLIHSASPRIRQI